MDLWNSAVCNFVCYMQSNLTHADGAVRYVTLAVSAGIFNVLRNVLFSTKTYMNSFKTVHPLVFLNNHKFYMSGPNWIINFYLWFNQQHVPNSTATTRLFTRMKRKTPKVVMGWELRTSHVCCCVKKYNKNSLGNKTCKTAYIWFSKIGAMNI